MSVTVKTIREMKQKGDKVAMITAYDFWTARLLDASGVDMILVGDSLSNVMLGHENTLPVTLDDMIHHAKAVARGVENALVVFDMPFMSYQVSPEEALRNAGRAMKETGCHAVKMEGGREIAATVQRIAAAGIPVVGHLGLTPQSVHQLGGYGVQAREPEKARRLTEDARALEEAGAFAIVLECVPSTLAAGVAQSVEACVIGIGAGAGCDGQVLVFHDMFGLTEGKKPKFVRSYGDAGALMREGVANYIKDVKSGEFPSDAESYHAPAAAVSHLKRNIS